MQYEWDEEKNRINKAKHCISFQPAVRIFDDPIFRVISTKVVDSEERWKSIGIVDGVMLVLVAHTWTNDDVIRVISARKASRQEQRDYAR